MNNLTIFKSLVGLHNQGLQFDKNQAKYIVYAIPSSELLMNCEVLNESNIEDDTEYSVQDIRKFIPNMLSSTLIHYETLYSKDTTLFDKSFFESRRSKAIKKLIIDNRFDVVTSNVDKLFIGTYNQAEDLYKMFEKDYSKMSIKNVTNCYRLYNFLIRFAKYDFDFAKAIHYDSIPPFIVALRNKDTTIPMVLENILALKEGANNYTSAYKDVGSKNDILIEVQSSIRSLLFNEF